MTDYCVEDNCDQPATHNRPFTPDIDERVCQDHRTPTLYEEDMR